jgi:HTH-type transcriptional regulator / antitoxin HigA
MSIGHKAAKPRDRYLQLVCQFPLRPLRSEAELDKAIAMVDSLVDRPRLSRGEQDYLDVLADIVERYPVTEVEAGGRGRVGW